MRILLWHVHGSWTTSFVHGPHEYVVPVLPGRGPDGVGIARTFDWPAGSVTEATPEELRDLELDCVLLQRPHELEHLCEAWTGRRPGRDLPAVYVEHNAPQGRVNELRHPAADRDDLLLVHVTHFNDLFWDAGGTPTRVVEHGIVDPGPRYTGELPRAVVVVNEARRRARVTGTDLLGRFAEAAPIDLFGMDALSLRIPGVTGIDDTPQAAMHGEMARRRVYLHPIRWTSLGLALLEAMHLGMPVVALGTTEVADAVPAEAGAVSTDAGRLAARLRELAHDPDAAREAGAAARRAALARYGLERFLADWDVVLEGVAGGGSPAAAATTRRGVT
jgi:glycosyltransferase involved in cell wall biosynthesis